MTTDNPGESKEVIQLIGSEKQLLLTQSTTPRLPVSPGQSAQSFNPSDRGLSVLVRRIHTTSASWS